MTGDLRRELQETLGTAYTLERDLGGGGMSRVFVARDEALGRDVVVKLLEPELTHGVSAERFAREIRIAAALQEPHIVPVLTAGVTSAGLPYYTMPLVRGESLRQRLERGRVPLDEARSILRDLAKALAYAHREGVVHRDIKPENILLSEGTAVVTDFGIARAMFLAADGARVTATGIALGTPAYMAPEQVVADPSADHRADLYALGLVGYEMLAGRHAFAGRSAQAMLSAQVIERPTPLVDAPPALATLVMRLLEKEPEARPQSAAEVLRALDGVSGPVPTGERKSSVAVLPFANVGGDSDTDYFSDGMTDELIGALARIGGLRVAARTSSFATKGRSLDAREAGNLLGVATVLEGSVRRSGQRLRITAQLIDADSGFQLWSERYDREMRDIFELQDDITRSIVGALRVRWEGDTAARVVATPTQDLEAYELYLKGRFAWQQRTNTTVVEAVRCFERAVARDPSFARAYAGLAEACLNLPMYTNTPPAIAWGKAKAAATAALERDVSLAEAHTSLANGTMLYEWDWARAEASFQRAIAADPNYANSHHWYGDFLAGRGRLDESLRSMRRAHELDPLSLVIGDELAWVLHLHGRSDEALAHIEQTLRLDPNYAHSHFALGLIGIGAGDYRGAVTALEKSFDLGGFYSFAYAALGYAFGRLGDRAAASRTLEELQARAAQEYVPPFSVAIGFLGVGDRASALDCLHRGVDERDVLLAENLFDPIFTSLRDEPRYRELLTRMEIHNSK